VLLVNRIHSYMRFSVERNELRGELLQQAVLQHLFAFIYSDIFLYVCTYIHIRARIAQYLLQVQERFTCTRTVAYEMSRTSYSARTRKIKCAR